ncbi:MAG: sensor domain-containing diguanylate cyclase [Nitriliruptor sp.]
MAFLEHHVPLGFWSVSRYDGERQVHLTVADHAYGLGPGASVPWSESLCERMVAGAGPRIAPDAETVPAYAERAAGLDLAIGAYVGIPIRDPRDGELFGTLCGIDPAIHGEELERQRPLLDVLAGLLAMVLDADVERTAMAREIERVELLAATDALTGLHNRRGWDRFLALEEARYRRFGDAGAVLVFDLDELKPVNDIEGHAAGDELLRATAHTLRDHARDTDFLARLGGDEFGLLAARTRSERIGDLVERLRAALDGAGVACSIGAAAYELEDGLAGAWDRADRAMYDDKAARRSSRAPVPLGR